MAEERRGWGKGMERGRGGKGVGREREGEQERGVREGRRGGRGRLWDQGGECGERLGQLEWGKPAGGEGSLGGEWMWNRALPPL